MRKLLVILMLSVALTQGPAAWAQSSDPQERAEELARQSLETLMRALDAMLDAVPQYALPEILENGDIIIRRIRPGDKESGDEESDMDQT